MPITMRISAIIRGLIGVLVSTGSIAVTMPVPRPAAWRGIAFDSRVLWRAWNGSRQFKNAGGRKRPIVAPAWHLQNAFPGLGRDIGVVALQPDQAAQGPAREQDESHHADGFEAALLNFHVFLGDSNLRRHFLLNPGLFGFGWRSFVFARHRAR